MRPTNTVRISGDGKKCPMTRGDPIPGSAGR